jgi:spore coat-associated protein N
LNIKKKLGLGAASAALGLSLIGGGTWAAFNDVERTTNTLTAGVLDLGLSPATGTINVNKLVPGDTITRSFDIKNNGNVDIDQVLLDVNSSGWADKTVDGVGSGNSKDDFLSQFAVTVLNAQNTNLLAGKVGTGVRDDNSKYISLKDLETFANGTFNITTGNRLPNENKDFDGFDSDTITISIEFVNKQAKDTVTGEYLQNQYQGEGVTLDFVFEATQKPGTARN